ncbi:MAG: hypothetical protein J5531_04180 [Lachnospiraceae bacterium]|nr:hypothetical protein [Lachnospiraceae bacterium]
MSYREFTSTDEVNEWAQEHFGEFLNYPDEPIYDKVYEYTGNTYIPINRLLRALPSWQAEECKDRLPEAYREFYDDGMVLYDYLSRFRIPEDVIVYRFLSREGIKELFGRWIPRKGRKGLEKAFMSTSLLLSAAKEFAKDKRGVMLRIRVPAGTHGLYVSQDQYKGNLLRECELLLTPGIQLQVVKTGLFRLECEMVEIT